MKRKALTGCFVLVFSLFLIVGLAQGLPVPGDLDTGAYDQNITDFSNSNILEFNESGDLFSDLATGPETYDVVEEEVTADLNTWVSLNESGLVNGSVEVVVNSTGEVLNESHYEIDLTNGSFKLIDNSTIQTGDLVLINYSYNVNEAQVEVDVVEAGNDSLEMNLTATEGDHLISVLVDKEVLNASVEGDIQVLKDGEIVSLADSLDEITNESRDLSEAEYFVYEVGENSSQVLIRNSNWSTHTFEVNVQEPLFGALGDSIGEAWDSWVTFLQGTFFGVPIYLWLAILGMAGYYIQKEKN